jgi:mannose/fructose-specific phosphotransferase system component IIA
MIKFIKAYEETLKDNEENKFIIEGNKGSAGSLGDMLGGTISNVFRLYHTRNINDGTYQVIGGFDYKGQLTLQLDMEDLEYLYNKYKPLAADEIRDIKLKEKRKYEDELLELEKKIASVKEELKSLEDE